MSSAKSVLIVGAGIAGIQAALDIAEAGFTAYLLEKEPSVGGRMATLDKTFPTNDCSICIEAPKMLDVLSHPHIHLLAYSEISEVKGAVGNFSVKITQKPRYVLADCTACAKCEEVCIVKAKSEFDQKIAERRAIYLSFPFAVPRVYTLDMENCRKYGGGCSRCVVACRDEVGHNLIDFWQKPRTIEVEVGSIIVATGYEAIDPSVVEEYGFGRYKNVVTGLQYERLLNSAGPTAGRVLRPSDGKAPEVVAFIQCVGSRDRRGRGYCCKVGCMYATKQAVLTRETNSGTTVYIFYMDRRFYGKGHYALYSRALEAGVSYVRARPSRLMEGRSGEIKIRYEDTCSGRVEERTAELVVLCPALIPNQANQELSRILGIPLDKEGFFHEPDPLLRPLATGVEGIYLCGFCRRPSDISESVAQASAAAAKAILAMKGPESGG